MPTDLKYLAHSRHAQLLHVELVENHRVWRLQVFHPAHDQIPWPLHRVIHVDAHDLHRLLPAIVPLPLRKARNDLLRVGHALDRPHLVQLSLAECDPLLDVGHILRRDPQVRARMVDQIRGRRRKPDKQPQLDDDQHH
jgi:hypothetical protein